MSIKVVNSILRTLAKNRATLYVENGQIILAVPGDDDGIVLMAEYRLGQRLPQLPYINHSEAE